MGEMKYKRVMGNGMMKKMRWQHHQGSSNSNGNGNGNSSSRAGIRLNLKRFLVSSLRPKVVRLLRVLSRWRVKALQALRLNTRNNNIIRSSSTSRTRLFASDYRHDHHGYYCNHHHHHHHHNRVRLTSLGRSNSFYAEAIADCLEFIKRSSISVDHHHNYTMSPHHQ